MLLRVIKDFAKENDKLIVKLVAIGGKLLDASQIERLAKMPTYDQAISMLMAVMKAPVEKAGPHPQRGAAQAGSYRCRSSRSERSNKFPFFFTLLNFLGV